jgi:hypothetical protein
MYYMKIQLYKALYVIIICFTTLFVICICHITHRIGALSQAFKIPLLLYGRPVAFVGTLGHGVFPVALMSLMKREHYLILSYRCSTRTSSGIFWTVK